MAKAEVKIRPMESEDTHGILEVDRKISGVQRALTYRDLVLEELGGEVIDRQAPQFNDCLSGNS